MDSDRSIDAASLVQSRSYYYSCCLASKLHAAAAPRRHDDVGDRAPAAMAVQRPRKQELMVCDARGRTDGGGGGRIEAVGRWKKRPAGRAGGRAGWQAEEEEEESVGAEKCVRT